jgi:hypothetical protein
VVSTFPYSSRSVARQQLLANSLRSENRAPLGAGYFCAPGLLLAKSGFGGLNNTAASPPDPFLSSAPPHEYARGAPTGATACGNAAAASPSFYSSPPPPLDSPAPPQSYTLRLPPQQYALGSPTGATTCDNAAAASGFFFSSPSPPSTACATASLHRNFF